jgi:serine protease inhibitor
VDWASNKPKGATVTNFTRVLVLAGAVTLTNALGSVTGSANQLLAAEPTTAPVNHAIKANNDFGVDLYAQLAKEKDKEGKNLFFSPYSMSSALAMTAEGARSQTADEMGKVLRFPDAARRTGDDAQLIPWKTALMHTGFAALTERFNADKPGAKEIRAKIADLRKQLDAANEQVKEANQQFYKGGNNADAWAAGQKAQKLADELNKLIPQVDQYQLSVANALWGEQTYPFEKTYVDTIGKFYGTGAVVPMDFKGDFEAARLKINDWAAKQTHDRIKDLIAKGDLDGLTRLVLTNAIYFKGQWEEPFKADATKDEDFLTADGKKAKVPMMHNGSTNSAYYGAFNSDASFFDTPKEISASAENPTKPELLYPDANGFEVLEMPYKGGDLSMVVIVPRAADKIADLEKKLTAANLNACISKLAKRAVDAYVPKFKLETGYYMKSSLQAMGMVRAFKNPLESPDAAQFDGMCASKDPMLKLYITKVIHKAFVEVNEKGTEAAAATAVVMGPGAGFHRQTMVPFVPTFRADKPFIFLIRDRKTDTILFLGRVMDPKE